MTLNILVGDDQVGAPGDSLERRSFERDYSEQLRGANVDYTDDPDVFVKLAAEKTYDALLIDLNWTEEDHVRDMKTGYRVIQQVQGMSERIILWTTEARKDHVSERALGYRATHCASKGILPSEMEELLGK